MRRFVLLLPLVFACTDQTGALDRPAGGADGGVDPMLDSDGGEGPPGNGFTTLGHWEAINLEGSELAAIEPAVIPSRDARTLIFDRQGRLYDPRSDRWSPTPDDAPLTPRRSTYGTWSNDQVLIFGGFRPWNSEAYDTNNNHDMSGAIYDTRTAAWRALEPCPIAPRRDYAFAGNATDLFVFGGSHYNGEWIDAPDGAIYEYATGTWSLMSTVDAPARGRVHAALATEERLIVIHVEHPSAHHLVHEYSKADRAWTQKPSLVIENNFAVRFFSNGAALFAFTTGRSAPAEPPDIRQLTPQGWVPAGLAGIAPFSVRDAAWTGRYLITQTQAPSSDYPTIYDALESKWYNMAPLGDVVATTAEVPVWVGEEGPSWANFVAVPYEGNVYAFGGTLSAVEQRDRPPGESRAAPANFQALGTGAKYVLAE